jgi:hypothetical protein
MLYRPIHWLRQDAVAARWGLSPRTLEDWRWRKVGPPYLKIGGRVHYRLQDIEAWEAAQVRLRYPSPAHAAFGVGGIQVRGRRVSPKIGIRPAATVGGGSLEPRTTTR